MNEQSFTDLLVPLVQPGYRLACALLHDPEAAQDAVQEASLIAWRKVGRLGDRSRLRAWFLGIVANQCRNARRRRWLTRVNFGLPPNLAVVSGEEQWVSRADVREALRRLSHEDRLVVSLFFYLDMPLLEVAAVAGTSVEAARSRLYRAVRRLRPDLEIEEALR
ncbi:MAG TPA: sigma-70 family RNA polymerase sigma factor [Candidatus Limnocylindrales bacterium]|nr:sigma-70 family RNA polymerase sigma factor [Candidatus Limnocylindrales bacterium]